MPKPDAPAIISEGTRTNTGVMRGRDVREALRGLLPPRAIETIAQIAEINHTNVLAIAELATMLDQFTDIVQGMADIAENMKTRTDQMVRATEQMKQAGEGNEDA